MFGSATKGYKAYVNVMTILRRGDLKEDWVGSRSEPGLDGN